MMELEEHRVVFAQFVLAMRVHVQCPLFRIAEEDI